MAVALKPRCVATRRHGPAGDAPVLGYHSWPHRGADAFDRPLQLLQYYGRRGHRVGTKLGCRGFVPWLGRPRARPRAAASGSLRGRTSRSSWITPTPRTRWERVLYAARDLGRGRLICVCGCGGDRDRGKRPLMGRVAGERAIGRSLTSDNPRSEDPQRIIDEMAAGVPDSSAVDSEIDRAQAIAMALAAAHSGDVVVIAGKGTNRSRNWPIASWPLMTAKLRGARCGACALGHCPAPVLGPQGSYHARRDPERDGAVDGCRSSR